MKTSPTTSRRPIWRRVHLWIGLGLGLLMLPIGLSGTLLVFATDLDRLINPGLYAVTGADATQDASIYVGNALSAAPGARAARLRFPATAGAPVTVLLRGGTGDGQPAPRDLFRTAYLDPPTGRILGVRDIRGSFVGAVHSFHANLLVPDASGRQIVGVAGIGLFTLTLTGLWLWWPRNTGLLRGLRWRRGATTSFNLHHMAGFWILTPLAVLALTGITLSFPPQARAVIGAFAALSPRPEQGGALLRQPQLDPGRVVALSRQEFDHAGFGSLSFPTEQAKLWRVQLMAADGETRTIVVDDTTASATLLPHALPGDSFAALLRSLHEGDHHGPAWQAIVFVTGFAPALLFLTGVLMWLRRRKTRLAQTGRPQEKQEKDTFEPGGHKTRRLEKIS